MRENIIYKFLSLFLFTIFTLLYVNTFAQSTGSIGGRAIDAKDNTPLTGASIKIVGSNQGAITDDNGEYVILNVDVGTYNIEASFIGMDTKRQTGVKVSVDTRTKVDFELTVAVNVTTEVIEVKAERKGIDVEQSGRIIETQSITNTGIRGVTNIVSKTAGVVQDERGGSINIRGGRSNESIIIVDGVETTNPLDGSSRASVPNNLLQEITVLTGGFGAEYGNVLSGVINVSTKSGTERYTGSLEVVTDEFTGRWFDTKSQGYNLYNFSIGGPIIPTKNLAKVFNFFGSFERNYQRMTIASWIVDKIPTIAPNGILNDNEAGSYSYSGRVSLNLSELPNGKIPINFKFGGTISQSKSRVLYGSNILDNSFKNPILEGNDYNFYGRLIHNVSNKFFYELQGSYFRSQSETFDPVFGDNLAWYGDTTRNPGLNAFYQGQGQGKTLGLDPSTAYLYRFPFGTIDNYSKSDVSYIGGKLDATWAILSKKYGDHEIKFGGELKYNTLKRISIYPAVTADITVSNRWYGSTNARLRTYGYDIFDPITGSLIADANDDNAGTAAKHPVTGGFYVRDKVSFADFNFNGGFRVDYLDVNDQVLKSITTDVAGPDGKVATDDDFTTAKPTISVSPRLGFSFPITDKVIFVAQYGKMIQLPPLNLLYLSRETLKNIGNGIQDVYENSTLKPTKLTQYEIGFKQQIGDYINLGLTAFYKESTDLIGAGRITADPPNVPSPFAAYLNTDFAISRGLDFYLSMRRMNRVAVDIAYTLSYATGTGSDAFSKGSLANDPNGVLPHFVYPLDYDQRHTGNINLDYRFGDNDVPKGFMGQVLKNLGVNLLFSFNSGRPYTRRDVSQTTTGLYGNNLESAKNELYKDWTFRLDMRIDKSVNIWKTNWNFYAYVINVLNTEIINEVFGGTGKPDDNGFLSTETGASVWATDPIFRQLWPDRIKFLSNWGPPRQIRFGVNITF